jgi:hypothetical protein
MVTINKGNEEAEGNQSEGVSAGKSSCAGDDL